MLDLHHRRPGQRVVAVQHAFRLAGRAGGEEELGERRRRRLARRDRLAVGLLAGERGGEVVPAGAVGLRQRRARRRRRRRGRARRAAGRRRRDRAPSSPAPPARRRRRQHRRRLRRVLAAAELVGDDQHRAPRAAQGEADLALAEDRHQGAADRADLHAGQGQDRRTRPSSAAGRRRSRPARPRARAAAPRPCRPRASSSAQVQVRVPPARTSTTASSSGRSRAQRPTQSTIGISAAWSIAIDSTARCPASASPVATGAPAAERSRSSSIAEVEPDRPHVVEEAGIGDPVGVRVGQRALAARPRGGHGQRHVDAVVVEAGERGPGQVALDPAHHQLVALLLDVAAHPVQLQHRDDPVGLLQPHVGDVGEARLALGELAHGGEHRQHVGHRPAVDLDPAQPHPVVADPHAAALAVELHRQPHLGDDVEEVGLGVVDPGAVDLVDAGEEDVGGVERGGGEAEGERADVGRQRDLGRAGGLVALDLEAAPVVGDPDLEPEVPHHVHRQLDVGLLVQRRPRPRSWSGRWRTGRR